MTFLRGLVVQSEVVHAVILRETRTRFGHQALGYLWALLDPMLIILTFWAIFHLAGRFVPFGMDVFSFITTGLIPYRLFSNSAGRVAESINGNRALLYYPQVYPIDLAIARGLLEAATFAAVFIVLMGTHALFTQTLVVHQPLQVVLGLVLASLLGSAVGLVFCSLQEFSVAVEQARGPLLRPLFWISGVFFTAESLSADFRQVALWNPIFHTVELVRAGWFTTYDASHVDLAYVLGWILSLGVAGLALERAVRRRIELT